MSTGKDCVDTAADFFLDITNDVCPMTFVRTKLLMERLVSGQTIEIRLCGEEPLKNLPKQLTDHGHAILRFAPSGQSSNPYGDHCLVVRKK